MTQTRTAGDPDDEQIVFTDLTPTRLEEELATLNTPASDDLIRQWMDEQNLRLRKIRKVLPGGESPDRDAQFCKIAELTEEYESAGNPYFSVDTKAKEFLGQLFRMPERIPEKNGTISQFVLSCSTILRYLSQT